MAFHRRLDACPNCRRVILWKPPGFRYQAHRSYFQKAPSPSADHVCWVTFGPCGRRLAVWLHTPRVLIFRHIFHPRGEPIRTIARSLSLSAGAIADAHPIAARAHPRPRRSRVAHQARRPDRPRVRRQQDAQAGIPRRQGTRAERGETVLFWQTGGTPALFAYAKELMRA